MILSQIGSINHQPTLATNRATITRVPPVSTYPFVPFRGHSLFPKIGNRKSQIKNRFQAPFIQSQIANPSSLPSAFHSIENRKSPHAHLNHRHSGSGHSANRLANPTPFNP